MYLKITLTFLRAPYIDNLSQVPFHYHVLLFPSSLIILNSENKGKRMGGKMGTGEIARKGSHRNLARGGSKIHAGRQ